MLALEYFEVKIPNSSYSIVNQLFFFLLFSFSFFFVERTTVTISKSIYEKVIYFMLEKYYL